MKRLESVASPIHKSTRNTATISVSIPWVGLTSNNTRLEIIKIGEDGFVPIEYPAQSFGPGGSIVFWLDSTYWNQPRGMYEAKVKINDNEVCRFIIEHLPRVIEREQVAFGVAPSDESRIFVRFPFAG